MNSLSFSDGLKACSEESCLDRRIEAPVTDGSSVIGMDAVALEESMAGCPNCEHSAAKSVAFTKVDANIVDSGEVVDIHGESVGMGQSASWSDVRHEERDVRHDERDVRHEERDVHIADEILDKCAFSEENKAPLGVPGQGASDIEVAQSAPSNDVTDRVCDIHVADENHNKSTSSEENKAPSDLPELGSSNIGVAQRTGETMTKATPLSSETSVSSSLIRDSTGSFRRKLLVLDLNGLLADIVSSAYVSDRFQPDVIISGKAVFKRPYCNEFMKFCFERFNVGIWSSRTKRNLNSVVDFLMGEMRHNLLFCWDQSHCTGTGYNTVENCNKPLVLKELKRLWEKSEPDLPWERGEFNESNTLLLDDSPYKALCNPPNTAIFPHSYQYKDEDDNSLGPGGDLYIYLEGLADAADVQTYVGLNPFGQRLLRSDWKQK